MVTSLLLPSLEHLRQKWGWFLALGIGLILLGTIALFMLPAANLAAVLVLGWVLVFSGVLEIVHAFQVRTWGGMLFNLAAGVLGLITGFVIMTNPLAGAVALTMLLAVYFTVIGVVRIVAALSLRFRDWGWAVFDGVVTLALGVLLWMHWPSSALWFIGMAVGISMLLRGWSYVMLALGLRRLPAETTRVREAA